MCSELANEEFLIAEWNEGQVISILSRSKNTCNAVVNKLLDKELSSEKRIILSSKLNIIVAILSIVSAIVGFGVGVLVSHSPKTNDLSTIKANLDACENRVSNLNHVVDSLRNENKILLEKVQTK